MSSQLERSSSDAGTSSKRALAWDSGLLAVLFVACVVLWIESSGYPGSARLYPRLVLSLIGIGLAMLMFQTVRTGIASRRKASSERPAASGPDEELAATGEEPESSGSWRDALLIILTFGAYLMAAFNFDFHISTAVFVASLAGILQGDRSARSVVGAVIFGVASVVVIHVIFSVVLGVRLPSTIL